jgi:Phospholipase_D-nuclease N-terminal
MLAATFGTGQVVLSILWLFLFFIEIWLMISVFIDIFRSDDLPGWAKAAWIVFVLVLPLIGILAYLVIRGGKMRAHQVRMIQEQEEAFRRYILGVVGSSGHSVAGELTRLAELRDRGYLTDQEFRLLKAQTLGGTSTV